ncbi:MAG: DUF1501 domain-containing protein [Planctomycetes bacterium]|nr:DUF1501 domain-containing protein [Planctomycetota bacterium]
MHGSCSGRKGGQRTNATRRQDRCTDAQVHCPGASSSARCSTGPTGGGIRGGQVYGASDPRAAFVKDRPVSPSDFHATIYHALGIAPDREIHDRSGHPYHICDGTPVTALF